MTLAIIAALTLGTTPRLGVCDPAPALGYGSILKGNPVRKFGPSRVTVVEFWATWCQPCIALMPHLSELWTQYKEKADFVSVSVMENDNTKVKPFVESMGDKMLYPVVLDKIDSKGKGFMYTRWLAAAGQDAIPVAFIVDQESKIAWIGHPNNMEPVLTKVIDKSWDAKAYKAKFDARMKDQDASTRLMKDAYGKISGTVRSHNYDATLKWLDGNSKKYDGPETQAALAEFKALFTPFSKGDYEAALKQAEKEPTNGLIWTYFRPMLLVAKIDALQGLKRGDEWRKVATQAIDGPPDPNMLMALVDALTLPDSKLVIKDSKVALRAAEKLTSLARVPMFLIRLAYAQYADGQIEVAKETLREAFGKMDQEKKNNPQYYDEMLADLKRAKAYFEKGGTVRIPTSIKNCST